MWPWPSQKRSQRRDLFSPIAWLIRGWIYSDQFLAVIAISWQKVSNAAIQHCIVTRSGRRSGFDRWPDSDAIRTMLIRTGSFDWCEAERLSGRRDCSTTCWDRQCVERDERWVTAAVRVSVAGSEMELLLLCGCRTNIELSVSAWNESACRSMSPSLRPPSYVTAFRHTVATPRFARLISFINISRLRINYLAVGAELWPKVGATARRELRPNTSLCRCILAQR